MDGGPLKHDRDFSALRDRYGIKDPDWGAAAEVESHLRLGVAVDDASHLVKPMAVPFTGWEWTEAAHGAGNYSGARLQVVSKGGLYILDAICESAGRISRDEPGFVSSGVEAPGLIVGDQGAGETVVHGGHLIAIALGVHLTYAATTRRPPYPIWFPSGAQIFLTHTAANATALLSFWIQEVP